MALFVLRGHLLGLGLRGRRLRVAGIAGRQLAEVRGIGVDLPGLEYAVDRLPAADVGLELDDIALSPECLRVEFAEEDLLDGVPVAEDDGGLAGPGQARAVRARRRAAPAGREHGA